MEHLNEDIKQDILGKIAAILNDGSINNSNWDILLKNKIREFTQEHTRSLYDNIKNHIIGIFGNELDPDFILKIFNKCVSKSADLKYPMRNRYNDYISNKENMLDFLQLPKSGSFIDEFGKLGFDKEFISNLYQEIGRKSGLQMGKGELLLLLLLKGVRTGTDIKLPDGTQIEAKSEKGRLNVSREWIKKLYNEIGCQDCFKGKKSTKAWYEANKDNNEIIAKVIEYCKVDIDIVKSPNDFYIYLVISALKQYSVEAGWKYFLISNENCAYKYIDIDDIDKEFFSDIQLDGGFDLNNMYFGPQITLK